MLTICTNSFSSRHFIQHFFGNGQILPEKIKSKIRKALFKQVLVDNMDEMVSQYEENDALESSIIHCLLPYQRMASHSLENCTLLRLFSKIYVNTLPWFTSNEVLAQYIVDNIETNSVNLKSFIEAMEDQLPLQFDSSHSSPIDIPMIWAAYQAFFMDNASRIQSVEDFKTLEDFNMQNPFGILDFSQPEQLLDFLAIYAGRKDILIVLSDYIIEREVGLSNVSFLTVQKMLWPARQLSEK